MAIPVYLFTGFLESGKTTFIQDTLEDKRFNSGERTLLLVCEEGEEEYEPLKFSGKNVCIHTIDSVDELDENKLQEMVKSFKAERVLVEYNGMWLIQNFYDNMPEDWVPYQNMLFFDTNTFLSYNANMRSLVVDKLSDCDVCVFNRIEKGFDTMELHKIVRASSRRTNILYEYADGTLVPDEIEDPLPFDINAPVINIEDRDFALFYRDLTEEMKKYKGKTVRFKALAATDPKFPDKTCALGRHIMTCCADDIQYCGLVSKVKDVGMVQNASWYIVTAEVDIRFSRLYGKKGPVFNVKSLVDAEPPEEQIATFY
ncbi:MAG: GTPase [Ruminococcaceae bacterium]|nr:GTPase [Oscillospiraceae bacterium]MBR3596294.1 GTPase [Clostridia bacterium]